MKKNFRLFIFFLVALCFPFICQASTTILTSTAPDHTITSGSDEKVYGTSASNEITLESGAKGELINFPGSNSIVFESDATLFTVYRSGIVVTFQGSDGTILKIPATTSVQTVDFSDVMPMTLSIHNGQVMLDDQLVNLTPALIENNQVTPYPANSPVAINGKLQVIGTQLCNAKGDSIQLRGISSHGIQWYGSFMNDSSIKVLVDDWKVDIIRASMYTAPDASGYISNIALKNKVIEIVDIAKKYGIYCIIDWHILSDNDPNTYKEESKAFFIEMATRYKDDIHVLYEICNEPNRVGWGTHVKPYAEYVIPAIQEINPDPIILVGTPTWSQDVDVAAADPLTFKNVMYVVHFYAGEHGDFLKNKLTMALATVPVFVSEWGTTMADGDRGVYMNESGAWLDLLYAHKISWCNWSISDKKESCALLKSGASKTGPWADDALTLSGAYVKKRLVNGYSPGPHTITVPGMDSTGRIEHGTILFYPNKKSYAKNELVTITVIPDSDYQWIRWNGLTRSENPTALFLQDDIIIWPDIVKTGELLLNSDFNGKDNN